MSDEKIAHSHAGHRQRQRERFVANRLNGFASHEVLELILGYAIPRQDVNPLAHRLIEHFGALHHVLDASIEELQRVEGVGKYTAVLLSLFSAVAAKCEESRYGQKQVLLNRDAAEQHCIRLLKGYKEEHFYAVYLNGQMEVLADVLIAKGSLSEVPSYPRVVADYALRYNAHAVILCHNHPGGTATPSPADLGSTARLKQVLDALEVRLIDHVIVAGQKGLSLMDNGLLQRLGADVVAGNRAANSAGEVAVQRGIKHFKEQVTEEE